MLSGATVPRSWHTVATIVEALCGIAGRSTSEERWPERDNWNRSDESWTFLEEMKRRWNAVLDDDETARAGTASSTLRFHSTGPALA